MPLYDLQCNGCNKEWVRYSSIADRNLPCEECNSEVTQLFKASAVIGDDIPGGIWIKNGICNEDGTPRKYYSKSEIAAEAARRGLVNMVRHVPDSRSGDKSRHTTKWY